MPAPMDKDRGVPLPVVPERAKPSPVEFVDIASDEAGYLNHRGVYVAPPWEDEEPQKFELIVGAKGFEGRDDPALRRVLNGLQVQLAATVPDDDAGTVPEGEDQSDQQVAEEERTAKRVIRVELGLMDAGSLKGRDDRDLVKGFLLDPCGDPDDLFEFRARNGSVTRVRANVRSGRIRLRCGHGGDAITASAPNPMGFEECPGGRVVLVRCLEPNGACFTLDGGWR